MVRGILTIEYAMNLKVGAAGNNPNGKIAFVFNGKDDGSDDESIFDKMRDEVNKALKVAHIKHHSFVMCGDIYGDRIIEVSPDLPATLAGKEYSFLRV